MLDRYAYDIRVINAEPAGPAAVGAVPPRVLYEKSGVVANFRDLAARAADFVGAIRDGTLEHGLHAPAAERTV